MEKVVKLYIDSPQWNPEIKPDDFAVAVGKTKSNSVYHIAEVRSVPRPDKRIIRYHIKCYRSDLITCLKRDRTQNLIPIVWYKRSKK